jgi:hypothetical protein
MPAISKAEAMQINAEPWEPLPGMVKVQCEECWFFFAAPHHTATLCPARADRAPRWPLKGENEAWPTCVFSTAPRRAPLRAWPKSMTSHSLN